jgi:hypothetical protein
METLCPIEQDKIDLVGQVAGERLQRVGFTNFYQIGQSRGADVCARPRYLRPVRIRCQSAVRRR